MRPGGGPGPGRGAPVLHPDPAEFAALAKEHTIVPVWCEIVADTLTPVTCFANIVGEGDGFLFESVEGGERWGRYSFVGRRPLATLTARGRRRGHGRLGVPSSDDGILAAVEALVPLPVAGTRRAAAAARGAGRVSRLRRGARGRAPPRSAGGRSRPPRRGAGRHRPVLRLRPLAPAHRAGGQRGGAPCARRRGRRRGVAAAYEPPAPARRAGGGLARPGEDRGRTAGGRTAAGTAEGRGGTDGQRGGLQGVDRGRQGVHPRRGHLPGRALATLRPRPRCRSL